MISVPVVQANKSAMERIRHITPAWFAITMGTGTICDILNHFPYGPHDIYMSLSLFLFAVNLISFVLLLGCSTIAYTLFANTWRLMLYDKVQSLFLATFPMGLATLIVSGVASLHDYLHIGGPVLIYSLWAVWWIDVALSIMSCFLLTYVAATRHIHSTEDIATLWMLPILAPIVASATGGVVATSLLRYSDTCATLTIVISALLVIVGLSMALMIITLYVLRLFLHGFPPGGLILSGLLPLGPCGKGGFSLLLIGQYCSKVLPYSSTKSILLSSAQTGQILLAICFCSSLILWCIGFFWAIISGLAIIERAYTQKIPFTVTAWGVIFPSGVYSILTFELGEVLDSTTFRVLGSIFSCVVIFAWIAMTFRTIMGMVRGTIFHAPYLDGFLLPSCNAPGSQENKEDEISIGSTVRL